MTTKFEFFLPTVLNADPDPLEPNPDDIGPGPLFSETPEQALAAWVETA